MSGSQGFSQVMGDSSPLSLKSSVSSGDSESSGVNEMSPFLVHGSDSDEIVSSLGT